MGSYRMVKKGAADIKALKKAKLLYYIDEFSVLLATLVAVIFSDAMAKRASGQLATSGDLLLDWMNLVLSGILALITYGSLHTQFTFNDKKKPPLFKRLSTAVLQGIAWRSIIGMVN